MAVKQIKIEIPDASHEIMETQTVLILDFPWFGALGMRLKVVPSIEIPTLATDGKHLYYNPAFFLSLPKSLRRSAVCHEILHCALGHCWRRGARNAEKWQVAIDHETNLLLKESGFEVGKSWIIDGKFKGMSAEQIYHLLPDPPPQKKDGGEGDSKDGHGDPDKMPGYCMDATDKEEAEFEWRVAVNQATQQARAMGKMPAGMEQFVEDLNTAKVNWKDRLRVLVTSICKNDYDWRRPNRRYTVHGLYLPSLYSETVPPVAVFSDTSGSVWDKQKEFFSELAVILNDARPECVYFGQCDTRVIEPVEELRPGDDMNLTARGGGGTSFKPPFRWLEEHDIQPAMLIYFTDLYGDFPDEPPPYPVIWATVSEGEAPFGETLYIGD